MWKPIIVILMLFLSHFCPCGSITVVQPNYSCSCGQIHCKRGNTTEYCRQSISVLVMKDEANGTIPEELLHNCSALIVSARHLITSAHCLFLQNPSSREWRQLRLDEMIVQFEDIPAPYSVKSSIIHPRFDPARPLPAVDIAVIKLESSLEFDTMPISTACLPAAYEVLAQESFNFIGHGQTAVVNESTPIDLIARFKFDKDCWTTSHKGNSSQMISAFFCADVVRNRESLSSGSAVVYIMHWRRYAVGLASQFPGSVGIFTYIPHNCRFIEAASNGQVKCIGENFYPDRCRRSVETEAGNKIRASKTKHRCDCGRFRFGQQTAHGYDVDRRQAVSVLAVKNGDNGTELLHECSGIIIGYRHVITAAHCLFVSANQTKWRALQPDEILIQIGDLPSGQFHVKTCKIHDRFRITHWPSANDIAVLTLNRSIDFKRYRVSPACLLGSHRIGFTVEVFVMGSGKTTELDGNGRLQLLANAFPDFNSGRVLYNVPCEGLYGSELVGDVLCIKSENWIPMSSGSSVLYDFSNKGRQFTEGMIIHQQRSPYLYDKHATYGAVLVLHMFCEFIQEATENEVDCNRGPIPGGLRRGFDDYLVWSGCRNPSPSYPSTTSTTFTTSTMSTTPTASTTSTTVGTI